MRNPPPHLQTIGHPCFLASFLAPCFLLCVLGSFKPKPPQITKNQCPETTKMSIFIRTHFGIMRIVSVRAIFSIRSLLGIATCSCLLGRITTALLGNRHDAGARSKRQERGAAAPPFANHCQLWQLLTGGLGERNYLHVTTIE